MLRWLLLAGGSVTTISEAFDAYAGVDAGALTLLDKKLPLDVAVGDFDSVKPVERERIEASAKTLVTAPSNKKDTDLEMAVAWICEHFPQAQLSIYGALGGRMDHALSNIFLPSHPDLFPHLNRIEVIDDHNCIRYLPQGQHEILPLPGYDYVAFMLEGQGELTIRGAKYEMAADSYFKRKIYGSNEFQGQPIQVTVPDGYLLVIYSKD